MARAAQNGITGIRLISGNEARNMEHQLSVEVVAALYAPNAGIVCPYEMTIAAMGNAMDNGVELLRNFAVVDIARQEDEITVTAKDGRQVEPLCCKLRRRICRQDRKYDR